VVSIKLETHPTKKIFLFVLIFFYEHSNFNFLTDKTLSKIEWFNFEVGENIQTTKKSKTNKNYLNLYFDYKEYLSIVYTRRFSLTKSYVLVYKIFLSVLKNVIFCQRKSPCVNDA